METLNPLRTLKEFFPKGFRHINFADDPHLITPARWNDLQAARWEVHPVFRTYLIDRDQAKDRAGRK